MFKRTILAIAVAALTLPGLAQAQENATLVLRSGERVSGQLIDFGGVGFTIKVNGQDRQIPTNDVSVIDFTSGTMSDADWAKLNAGEQLVWLKSGQTVNGQLYDISGTTPLKIIFKTSGGDREFSSAEIGRIVLSRPASTAVPTTGVKVPDGQGIVVSAQQQWTPTGLTVRKGEVITFTTTGDVQLSTDASDLAGSAGSKTGRNAQSAPIPGALAGALIARIGNGRPFPIGDQTSVPMPESGQLFLGINDDDLNDNQGGFRVDVKRASRR
ncbi:MAG: hypothetical protein LC753_00280 [Acidobacteria bacterium]|nr:hypothetical protein [Acidobacteriota bacterium]